jgi:hypothetical protein
LCQSVINKRAAGYAQITSPRQKDNEWAVEVLYAPGDPVAQSLDVYLDETEAFLVHALGAEDFQPAYGY